MLRKKRSTLEASCRRWLLALSTGLLSLAVLLAGVSPAALAEDKKDTKPPKDTKKDDKAKDTKKDDKDKPKDDKAKPKDDSGFPDIDKLLEKLPGLDERQMKIVRQQLEAAKRQMDQALKLGGRLGERLPIRPRDGLFGRPGTDNRLGAKVAAPASALSEQLDLPKGQGLVVEDVTKDSPASKVGMKPNDILLELAGKPVSNQPAQLAKQLEDIEADKAVDVVVLRKGKKETLKGLTLPEAKPARAKGDRTTTTSTLTLTRTNDQFTLVSREGTRMIQLRGKLKDGKAESLSIQISEGRQSDTYDSVEKVPEGMREEVKGLLALCEKKASKEAK